MHYDDVPSRVLGGERVPASEVMAYLLPMPNSQSRLIISWLVLCGVLAIDYNDGVKKLQLTPFGALLRRDFVKRIDGDCPDE